MPLVLYERHDEPDSTILLWRASESTEELLKRLQPDNALLSEYQSIRLEKRKREWLVSRILLQLCKPQARLENLPNGKPVLDRGYCSFSHCAEYGGLILSDHAVGLDIQGIDERLMRIAPRYCNPTEIEFANKNAFAVEIFTILWSAKEAIFKYFGENVVFSEDIVIRPFHKDQEFLTANYQGKHGKLLFTLRNTGFLGYHIVYTMHVEKIESDKHQSIQWESNP
jgi:phosphopantetheinyl transferase